MPGLEQVAGLKHPTSFGNFEFSPTGDEVAISSRLNALTALWNTRTWERTHMLTNCSRLLYTPDGRHLWLTRSGRKSGLYEARTLEPLLLLPAEMRPLALSPDARRVVMSVDMERLQVWDLSEIRNQLHTFGLDWAESRHIP
jgi:WD40 repeat protein